ncbi:Charged multivesicular body protein 3 [Sciurus carolinensis]|uniref:Charged multivesicular body protein 3 n=1 Tax=Sciurus carolinensis TaxID=30640 RepID=A0AA41N569_SCICA|nr:Charged multivesicular body protein 3 [Sciurus carolinensis]
MGLFGKTQEKPPKELRSPPRAGAAEPPSRAPRALREPSVCRARSAAPLGGRAPSAVFGERRVRRPASGFEPVSRAGPAFPCRGDLPSCSRRQSCVGPPCQPRVHRRPAKVTAWGRRASRACTGGRVTVVLSATVTAWGRRASRACTGGRVNEWSLKIRKEMRVVDRQIRDIQREEEKVKRSVKDAAKKGQKDVCVVLAKEMIRSRKAVSKLYASKAHMNSVLMGMKNQLAVLRVAGSLQKSTEVMKAMQSLVKIPEIQATMRELSKEMMKAGIIEEMLEDTFESMDDQEEMEEEAEMEIDKILFEITAGALGKAPSKVTDALPEPEPQGAMAASEDEEEEEALEAMQSRLATLRS